MISLILLVNIFSIIVSFSIGSPANFPKPRLDGRIVGGYTIDINDVPYQVSLQSGSRHICGGSIIDEKWILTAAHCTQGQNPSNLKVRIGSGKHSSGGELIQVKRIIIHEKFTYATIDYDFSLLELQQKITFDGSKQPIRLPEQNENLPDNTNCLVTGWGNTQNANEGTENLRGAIVPIFNQDKCQSVYMSFGGITERMICAGYEEGGKDACQGDSGGPLAAEKTLIGVVSWGYGCARPAYPGVYSRVSSIRNWITEKSGI